MKYFGLLAVFLCLLGVGLVFGESDTSMYFESSGDGAHTIATDLPIDDEDTDEEGSGSMPPEESPTSTFYYETSTTPAPYSTLPNTVTLKFYEEEGELYTHANVAKKNPVATMRNASKTFSNQGADVVLPKEVEIETIDIDNEPEVDTGKSGKPKTVIIDDNDMDDNNEIDMEEKNKPVDKEIDQEELEDEEVAADEVAASSTTSFMSAMIVGGCIGLLFAICVIMLLVYRMRKKDEGSYPLEYGLDKKPQGNYEYTKGVDSKEYFA